MPIDLTLYERLEVSPTDSEHDIKKAGRKMALRWHPDKNLDCQEEATIKFKEIQEAVDILTDPQRRLNYDQFGLTNMNNAPSQFPQPFQHFSPFPFPFPFPFEMPGMGMPPGMRMPGIPGMPPGMGIRMNGNVHNLHDVHHTLLIPSPVPENITFSYQRHITCQNCLCTHCNGKGVIIKIQQMGMITIQHQTSCLECANHRECIRCDQKRLISTEHTMTINIKNQTNIQTQNIQLCIPNEGHQLCTGNTNLIIDMKFV
jgi:DnaJ-class molecular chaperone